jgi:predicted TIM-barrel fold metal-dependent hydrolase
MYTDRKRTIGKVREKGFTAPQSLLDASWESFLEERDRARIEVCVVPGRYTTQSYGRVSNEDLAELARRHRGRFVCFAAVDGESDEAANQLEFAVKDLGLSGLTLDAASGDPPRYADDPLFEPLYRRCARLGVPVMVTYSGFVGPDIGYVDPVRMDRVAAAFPDLSIVVVHAGWPWVPQMIGVAYRRPNVFLSPDMYLINMPGASMYVEAANGLLRERLLFGSSYPFIPMDAAVGVYTSLPFKEDVLRNVMGRNGARLLKLG